MNIKSYLSKYTLDIRFWIIIAFIVRLYGITFPPLETGHNWRQADVNTVARNFLEIDNSIFYPRVDSAGSKSGITGMEFPILNYLIYLMSFVFGFSDWYGRLINLVVSSFGVFAFYGIIKKIFTKELAFLSAIVYMFSLTFTFARKVMPDTFSISLVMLSVYFALSYFYERKSIAYLFLFFILGLFGILSKLPSAVLMLPVTMLLFSHKVSSFKKGQLIIAGTVIAILTGYWYFYWVPYLNKTYGYTYFFMGRSIADSLMQIRENLVLFLKRFYETPLKFTGFIAYFIGLILSILKRNKLLFMIFGISSIAMSAIIAKAGYHFYHHNYYIIPFIPIMALFAGYSLTFIRNRNLKTAAIIIIVLENIGGQFHDFRVKEKAKNIPKLESVFDQFSNRSDLIVVNGSLNPVLLFYSHRKGWTIGNEQIKNQSYMNSIIDEGCKYILIQHPQKYGMENLPYKTIYKEEQFLIYETMK